MPGRAPPIRQIGITLKLSMCLHKSIPLAGDLNLRVITEAQPINGRVYTTTSTLIINVQIDFFHQYDCLLFSVVSPVLPVRVSK